MSKIISKSKKLSYILIFFTTLNACEDVIEVDVPSEAPRLIIDAVMRIDTSLEFNLVQVKVSLTDSFFGSIPPANLEQITMVNLDNPVIRRNRYTRVY